MFYLILNKKLGFIKYHKANPKAFTTVNFKPLLPNSGGIDVKRRTVGNILHISEKKEYRESEL
jgi:hypothetical protein